MLPGARVPFTGVSRSPTAEVCRISIAGELEVGKVQKPKGRDLMKKDRY